ncbi:hypothetical protein KP509_20G017400 [Ceratopteris richardii]|uniref:Uncharacterized protein n=1 Tax=Ceratopteris richardii TaxID=49495 RepID=A0A8T2SGS2_CERRI|nr:hypothetical protein KP509_20G017400 [Ceratopteris richardii]
MIREPKRPSIKPLCLPLQDVYFLFLSLSLSLSVHALAELVYWRVISHNSALVYWRVISHNSALPAASDFWSFGPGSFLSIDS